MMVHLVNVRADAARNSARIFEAARQLVAAQGPEVPMEAIAGRAGVAVGTLYRHHPTKAALLLAVLTDSAEQLADATEQALQRVHAGAPRGCGVRGAAGAPGGPSRRRSGRQGRGHHSRRAAAP